MQAHTASIYNVIVKPSARWMELPLLLSFNLLLVLTAYISFNLPFSPVPITGQTFGVLVIAMALGRVRGTGVVLAYLVEGAAGLPVFAGGAAGAHVFLGPTGGYLIGFLAAAWLVGSLADRGFDRHYMSSILAMALGTALIFATGLAWLSYFIPIAGILAAGLMPFLPGAAVKIALASILLPTVWKFLGRHTS